MIEGSEGAIFSVMELEEKKAKDNISRYYKEKEKDYIALIEKKKDEKKAIMKAYYDSIAKNSEGYLKREDYYVRIYEDYKLLLSEFNRAWERTEERIREHPDDYVRFALAKFQQMLGTPESAIASEEFHPYVKYKAPTELSKKKMELRIFRGKAFADFSPSFIKEFVMPLYADKVMGEG